MTKIGDNRLAILASGIRDAHEAIAASATAIAERSIQAGHASSSSPRTAAGPG